MSLPLFFAIYCFEAGLFFIVVPWTRSWAANPLLHHSLAVAAFVDNPFIRGLITGFGVVHLLLGVREIARMRDLRSRVS